MGTNQSKPIDNPPNKVYKEPVKLGTDVPIKQKTEDNFVVCKSYEEGCYWSDSKGVLENPLTKAEDYNRGLNTAYKNGVKISGVKEYKNNESYSNIRYGKREDNPNMLIELISNLDKVETSKGEINIIPKVDIRTIKRIDTTYKNEDISDSLKKFLNPMYSKILVLFLKSFKNSLRVESSTLCSEDLRLIVDIFIDETNLGFYKYYSIKQITFEQLKGIVPLDKTSKRYREVIFTDNDVQMFVNKLPNITESNKQKLIKEISVYTSKTNLSLKNIKEEFLKCTSQYYIIPLSLSRLYTGGHKTLIILDKFNKNAMFIEPRYYATNDTNLSEIMNKQENDILDKILNEIEISEYQKILPITPFPQSIAGDKNCMFWTFLITVTFLLNPGAKDPNVIAEAIIKKYPTKEELIDYIVSFRTIVGQFTYYFRKDVEGGKKRRRTYRKKKLTSRKQIVSKSSRNLRTGTSKANTYR